MEKKVHLAVNEVTKELQRQISQNDVYPQHIHVSQKEALAQENYKQGQFKKKCEMVPYEQFVAEPHALLELVLCAFHKHKDDLFFPCCQVRVSASGFRKIELI